MACHRIAATDDVDPRDGDRETMVCEYCGAEFDPDDVPTTQIPSTVLLRCSHCGRWTEMPEFLGA